MIARILRIARCSWVLQTAFDDSARENYFLAKCKLDKISAEIECIDRRSDLGIQIRMLQLFVDLQITGVIYIGYLISDIRRSIAFNNDEKILMIKYILSIIYLSFPRSRRDALIVAQKINFDRTKVGATLLRRYDGCTKILLRPQRFVGS